MRFSPTILSSVLPEIPRYYGSTYSLAVDDLHHVAFKCSPPSPLLLLEDEDRLLLLRPVEILSRARDVLHFILGGSSRTGDLHIPIKLIRLGVVVLGNIHEAIRFLWDQRWVLITLIL